MLRRGRRKYVWCAGDPEQLYDLDADPRELRNLAPGTGCADLRAEVRRRWDLGALRDAVLRSQDERRLVARALATGRRRTAGAGSRRRGPASCAAATTSTRCSAGPASTSPTGRSEA